MDRYDDTPLHEREAERSLSKTVEQEEWERDPEHSLMFPKPTKRFRASEEDWEIMRRYFSKSRCVVCDGDWHSLHHVYKRSQGGDDVLANLVPVCGSGTTGCHGKIELRDPRALFAVRASLRDQTRWYLTWKLGAQAPGWLDRAYPELEIAA